MATPAAQAPQRRLTCAIAAGLASLSAIAVILVVATTQSRAQSVPVFAVIDTTDAPDAQLNGVCASTYQGLCTLRAAVQEAEFAGGGRIVLSAGIGDYRLTIPAGPEANPFLSCPAQPPGPSSCPTNRTGDLDIRTNVIVNGIGVADSVIDGANINRIFDVHAEQADVRVVQSFREPGFIDRAPELFDLRAVFYDIGAAEDRNECVSVRVGVRGVYAVVRLYLFDLPRIVLREEP